MMLPIARAAAPLAALAIAASLLAGCSDDGGDSSDEGSTESTTTGSSEPTETSMTDDSTAESTDEPTVAAQGCDLITPAEAEEILGGPLEDPLESPPTIECQYVLTAGGGTLDLYKGDAATAALEAQEQADPEFATESLDGVGEEAEVVSFADCGGVYFRTSDDTWWFLTTVCDSDEWDSRTRPRMIDLATTIVSRLEP